MADQKVCIVMPPSPFLAHAQVLAKTPGSSQQVGLPRYNAYVISILATVTEEQRQGENGEFNPLYAWSTMEP